MQREDRLLEGAFDTHVHTYPEFTLGMPPRVSNVELTHRAVAAGMRGLVMKSHLFPTATTALMMRELQPDLEVLGSISCNAPVGGLNPFSVEVAAQTGARVVWLPTWSARLDQPRQSAFLDRMRPWISTLIDTPDAVEPIGILAADGSLLPEVARILQLCRRYGMTVATGHIPVAASLILAEEAQSLGVRLVLTHPLNSGVNATLDDQRAIVAHGGMIEHVFVGCMPMHHRLDPRRIVEAIEAVGPDNCVLGSDAIEAWNPPAPEILRMFIATLLALGVDEGAVRQMTHDNPLRALGLDDVPGSAQAIFEPNEGEN